MVLFQGAMSVRYVEDLIEKLNSMPVTDDVRVKHALASAFLDSIARLSRFKEGDARIRTFRQLLITNDQF